MNHILNLFISPKDTWSTIRDSDYSIINLYLRFVCFISLIPVLSWHYGATRVGWIINDHTIKLTAESSFQIMTLFYLSILSGILFLGFMFHWMSGTYGATKSTISKGVSISAFACTPMFLIGITGLYPILWLDILLACTAACTTIYLVYIGVPIMFDIPKEQGFLYASAMMAVGLVMCAALLGITVILWEMGAMPVFTD